MATTPHQLFLLADHIKLSLLERQRAGSRSSSTAKQDTTISRSLDSLREGLTSLESQRFGREAAGEPDADLPDQITRLRTQLQDLESDFSAITTKDISSSKPTTKTTDDSPLSQDFTTGRSRPTNARQQQRPSPRSSSLRGAKAKSPGAKAVRFRDDPSAEPDPPDDTFSAADEASRAALFDRPYTDEPDPAEETARLDNRQIHAYHKRVLQDQDEQLDELGRSIGRQRDLSIQMGNELDDQAVLLEDVERGVDRHQGTLDRAQGRLKKISKSAKENASWVTIGCLIIILVLLIVLVK